jgi:hypothetical protein
VIHVPSFSNVVTSITPWNRVLEKLRVTQLVKILAGLYDTLRFIFFFIRAHH